MKFLIVYNILFIKESKIWKEKYYYEKNKIYMYNANLLIYY